jgi:hypothetical protein
MQLRRRQPSSQSRPMLTVQGIVDSDTAFPKILGVKTIEKLKR